MPLFHIVILALVQGLTEFLPVSSSGHLVMAHAALGHTDTQDNLTLDIAVHVGTLIAVLFYFRTDVKKMMGGLWALKNIGAAKSRGGQAAGARLALYVLIGSLPVIVAGFAIHTYKPLWTRSLEITAFCTIVFGILLWAADRKPVDLDLEKDMSAKKALLIGLAQVLALIPGTSRSGITMTAARYLGFNRTDAARYSLLLAIIAISGAGVLTGIDLLEEGRTQLTVSVFYAVILSAVSGWAAIALLMRWLEKASFTVFAVYRIFAGTLLFGLLYSGAL